MLIHIIMTKGDTKMTIGVIVMAVIAIGAGLFAFIMDRNRKDDNDDKNSKK